MLTEDYDSNAAQKHVVIESVLQYFDIIINDYLTCYFKEVMYYVFV